MELKKGALSSLEYKFGYVDASPSELIQNSSESFLCVGITTFFKVDRDNLLNLTQFKKVRGIKRKLQVQNYLIQAIHQKKIVPFGMISWNYRDIALKNGEFILKDAQIIHQSNQTANTVVVNNHEISIGLATSLGWYAIVIAMFLKFMGEVAKAVNQEKVAIFLDLLPGDNFKKQRNFEIVEQIINNSQLKGFQENALADYNLNLIGYGYGMHDKSTKNLKNDYEFVITDWIVQSFYSLIKYEKEDLDKSSEAFKLSKLATFLIDNRYFKIKNAFSLIQ
ncbi:hypothetical protein CHU92_10745 [Flavobacterium cyanobacteriorum]|uniref:Uncharacterized protein n=1 Tax=Flavobacterium cyanobacteriorum TaxID=2022802 RepID=A0A255Z2F5_9FLAO|nr:hypothetical protein [Flavobacterium cyanobacteriorum]OYQ35683.1 hypothetical protein CHU92_10745 [Flavobacterium cyanobacteriorum]